MSVNTDNGDQVLTFDYNVRANASLFNKLIYKILPVGLYGDMPTLDIVSNSEVTVGIFNAVIEDTLNELAIKVSTTSTASAVVSSSAPYIIARYTWSETDENYVEILGVSESNLSDQYAIIGLCVYDGATLESFDTSVQDDKTRALQTVMDVVEADIDTLESKVGQSLNTDDAPTFADITITGLSDTVENSIETNTSNISSNTSNISSNTSDISTNASDISTLEGKVGQSLNTTSVVEFGGLTVADTINATKGRTPSWTKHNSTTGGALVDEMSAIFDEGEYFGSGSIYTGGYLVIISKVQISASTIGLQGLIASGESTGAITTFSYNTSSTDYIQMSLSI